MIRNLKTFFWGQTAYIMLRIVTKRCVRILVGHLSHVTNFSKKKEKTNPINIYNIDILYG